MATRLRVLRDHLWSVPGRRALIEVKAGTIFLASSAHAAALLADGAAQEITDGHNRRRRPVAEKAGAVGEDSRPDPHQNPRGA
jgi:hypothetical protein